MRYKILIAILAAGLSTLEARSQSSPFQTFIEEYLAAFPNNSEIAIGIIDGNNVYKLGYQLRNGNLISVRNESTLFEIGSISKVFAAALLMSEVKRNAIALNDPIQKHLLFKMEQDTYQNQPVTVLHLITHTSGLKKNPLTGYKRYSHYLKRFELTYVPGKKWEYNNLAVSLAGKLTAEKAGSSWDVLVKRNILRPLNMNSTFTNLGETPKINRVQCIDKRNKKGECYFHRIGEFQWPNGGIISNVEDMLKWLQANLSEEHQNTDLEFIHDTHDPLADTISTAWFRKYNATQGIGWWHYKTDSSQRIICHGGNMPGQTSFMAFDKVKNRGIIILTNVDGKALLTNDKMMKTTELSIGVLGLKNTLPNK